MRTLRRLGVLVVVGLLGLGPGLVIHGTAQAAGVTWYVNGTTGTDPSTAPELCIGRTVSPSWLSTTQPGEWTWATAPTSGRAA